MSEINIRELARELNLSIGTVSKALRNSHEISNETKEKVFALARQLNYIPNPYASSLRRKKSNTIGIVVPEVADSFFFKCHKPGRSYNPDAFTSFQIGGRLGHFYIIRLSNYIMQTVLKIAPALTNRI